MLDDHQLMQSCQGGDAAAFEELVRRWQLPLGRLIGRLTGPPHDVDDLCQEVFVRVLGAMHRYRPEGAFFTWLYPIALNVTRDAHRKVRRRPNWHTLEHHEPLARESSPETTASGHEVGEQIKQALAELPDKLREAVVLKHFGELTFEQTAQVLHLPVSTVKSRVHTALVQLRHHLREHGID